MAPRNKRRIEFSKGHRILVAQRAGYRCSFPSCNRLTIGPGVQRHKPLCIGVASHIYSASPRGPRGSGGLTTDELSSPENAIWLCPDHATLIDKNDGREYPPETLHVYKMMHENRISLELRGLDSDPKWVKSIRVISSPLFVRNIKLDFARLTFISGLNSSGKTALCQWIASSVYPHYLERWSRIPDDRERVNIEVEYTNYGSHAVAVSFARNDRPNYRLDSNPTIVPTAPLKIIFPQGIRTVTYDDGPNDIQLIAKLMNLHSYNIRSLCEELNATKIGYFKQTYFEESGDTCVLLVRADAAYSKHPIPFRQLGDSTCGRFLMELGIIAAKNFSRTYPTVLILDSDFYRLDRLWADRYAELLASPEIGFQTIITLRPNQVDFKNIRWIGWNSFKLVGRPPNVTVRRSFRSTA